MTLTLPTPSTDSNSSTQNSAITTHAVALPDPRAIPPPDPQAGFPKIMPDAMKAVDNACLEAVKLYETEKNQRDSQYTKLKTALEAIPNLDAAKAKVIQEYWKKLDNERPKIKPVKEGWIKSNGKKLLGRSDEDKPYVFEAAHKEHLRLLLTAITLGEVGSLAFWAHRALSKSELRYQKKKGGKKRFSTRKPKEQKIKDPYPAATATLMLMNAILGPFEERPAGLQGSQSISIIEEILQDYKILKPFLGGGLNSNDPSNPDQLQIDIQNVFENHENLRDWLFKALKEDSSNQQLRDELIKKREEEWKIMNKAEKRKLYEAFTNFNAEHMRQITGTKAQRARLHGPFSEILPEVDKTLPAYTDPVQEFHEDYMKRLGLRYRIDGAIDPVQRDCEFLVKSMKHSWRQGWKSYVRAQHELFIMQVVRLHWNPEHMKAVISEENFKEFTSNGTFELEVYIAQEYAPGPMAVLLTLLDLELPELNVVINETQTNVAPSSLGYLWGDKWS
ncbi:hypothetical protein BZA77DRAFT_48832 [Pyronema omphalodes]|nr:hypothetical protein BZA77DRAFT_48832 [Pyronema omphalodes]